MGRREEGRDVHGPAEIRGQRRRLRDGDPDSRRSPSSTRCRETSSRTSRSTRSSCRFPSRIWVDLDPRHERLGRRSPRAARGLRVDARTQGRARTRASTVLEAGVVGSLDYKIIVAEQANGLFDWLKENSYVYSGDEATLDFYIQKKWFFTVMKIDPKQMKKNRGRVVRRRSHADALHVRQRQVRLPAEDHAAQRQGQDRRAVLRAGPDADGPARATCRGCTPTG